MKNMLFVAGHFILTYYVWLWSLLFFLVLILGLYLFLLKPMLVASCKKHFLKKYFFKNKKYLFGFRLGDRKNAWWIRIKFFQYLREIYYWANLPFNYEFFLFGGICLLIGVLLIGKLFFSVAIVIELMIVVAILYFGLVVILAKRGRKKIPEQLPFALEMLTGSLQSGYSLPQAIKFVEQETFYPLKLFFQDMVRQIEFNRPLIVIFEDIKNKTDNEEFQLILESMIMQDKMGGDIIKMLKRMSQWIRQKNKLKKDIKTFISQGRLSGLIIVLLWPFSALMFYVVNSEYIQILFTTDIGRSLLLMSLVLEVIGFLMIWRIIKIKI